MCMNKRKQTLRIILLLSVVSLFLTCTFEGNTQQAATDTPTVLLQDKDYPKIYMRLVSTNSPQNIEEKTDPDNLEMEKKSLILFLNGAVNEQIPVTTFNGDLSSDRKAKISGTSKGTLLSAKVSDNLSVQQFNISRTSDTTLTIFKQQVDTAGPEHSTYPVETIAVPLNARIRVI